MTAGLIERQVVYLFAVLGNGAGVRHTGGGRCPDANINEMLSGFRLAPE
jgi:hypothetical protein